MMNVLRTEYVNPQAAASRSSQMNPANTPADSEKRQRTLEEEKKAVQNSLLLMKTTSGVLSFWRRNWRSSRAGLRREKRKRLRFRTRQERAERKAAELG